MREFLPTGKPVVGQRRTWGTVPEKDRWGVGVVGLHEGRTMLAALATTGLCRAVAACDLSETKRAEVAAEFPHVPVTDDFDQLLAHPEVRIVAIYTPDALHADQIEAAFRAGKHVICTKPLVHDPAVAPRLLRAAQETGGRLQVGQSTRFYEPFLRQRERFAAGEYGSIEVVDAHYNHRMDWYYEKSPWAATETHWAYLGLSHPVDLVRWYLGEIAEVHAYGTTTALGQSYGLAQPDALIVSLRATNGRLGRVLGNYGLHELPRGRAHIECFLMGSGGTSVARYPELRLTTLQDGVEIEEDYDHAYAGFYYRHELKGMHYGEFANLADSFAHALIHDQPNAPDLVEGLGTVLVMGAIVESLKTGLPVRPQRLETL